MISHHICESGTAWGRVISRRRRCQRYLDCHRFLSFFRSSDYGWQAKLADKSLASFRHDVKSLPRSTTVSHISKHTGWKPFLSHQTCLNLFLHNLTKIVHSGCGEYLQHQRTPNGLSWKSLALSTQAQAWEVAMNPNSLQL